MVLKHKWVNCFAASRVGPWPTIRAMKLHSTFLSVGRLPPINCRCDGDVVMVGQGPPYGFPTKSSKIFFALSLIIRWKSGRSSVLAE